MNPIFERDTSGQFAGFFPCAMHVLQPHMHEAVQREKGTGMERNYREEGSLGSHTATALSSLQDYTGTRKQSRAFWGREGKYSLFNSFKKKKIIIITSLRHSIVKLSVVTTNGMATTNHTQQKATCQKWEITEQNEWEPLSHKARVKLKCQEWKLLMLNTAESGAQHNTN